MYTDSFSVTHLADAIAAAATDKNASNRPALVRGVA